MKRDWLFGLLLLGLVLLFLGRGLGPGQVWLPLDIVVEGWPPWQPADRAPQIHNVLLGDAVNYIYPIKEFTADAVRQGILPLWNPYVMGGYPLTYNTQAGLFYPLSIFYYLWPGVTAVNLTILTQLLLGGLFSYLYLRLICRHRLAMLAGTIIFLFNGMMVVWLSWQVVHAAMIWLPLQLYLAERMVRSVKAANPTATSPLVFALLTGGALALPWLGGHWNWTLYTSMTLGCYLLWQLWPQWRSQWREGAGWSVVGWAALPLLVGFLLSLVQVWPAVTYLAQTHRGTLPFTESLTYGLWNRAVVLLVPNFFGDPITGNWWGHDNYNETTLYLGILPLFLSGLVFWLRRDRLTLFWLGWGVLGLLWALGTPLYGLLYVLPVFGGLLPSRAAVLVVVAVAILSALALDQLLAERAVEEENGRFPKLILLPTLFFILVVAAYYWFYRQDVAGQVEYLLPHFYRFAGLLLGSGLLLWARWRNWLPAPLFGWLVVGWLVFDLFSFGYDYNTVGYAEQLYPETAVSQFLHNDPDLFRIVSTPHQRVYPPNSALVPRLANISGYEPGISSRYLNYVTLAEGASPLYWERQLMPWLGVESPLLAALNLKYILTIEDRWAETAVIDIAQPTVTTWYTLTEETAIRQPILMEEAGLQQLSLHLQSTADFTGEIVVRILAADGGQEFANATLAGPFVADAPYDFYVSPFPAEWGRAFMVQVGVTDGGVEVGLGQPIPPQLGPLLAPEQVAANSLALTVYYLPRPNLLFEDGKTRIYLNEGYFPRAYAVPTAVIAPDETAVLATLQQEMDRLDQLVVLELEGQPAPPLPDLDDVAIGVFQETAVVAVTDYGLNQVQLTADLPQAGFVVLSDTYYPGWRAKVNGVETAVYRANSIVRAIYLPAGQHEILLYFQPTDFIIPAALTILTFIMVVGILIYHLSGWNRSSF